MVARSPPRCPRERRSGCPAGSEPARTGRAYASSASPFQESFLNRLTGPVILPKRAAIRRRRRIAARVNDPSRTTNGLPRFSRSSSNLSDGNIVAHPAGQLFRFANDTAESSSRKIPPICPFTSRATQKPSLLRPMKNAGIVSLTIRDRAAEMRRDGGGLSVGRTPGRLPSCGIAAVEDLGDGTGRKICACQRHGGHFASFAESETRDPMRAGVLGFRRGMAYPVRDKGIEHLAVRGERGFEMLAGLLSLLGGIEGDRGHGGLLTNPTAMMCRRGHRNARWLGIASHKRDIKP